MKIHTKIAITLALVMVFSFLSTAQERSKELKKLFPPLTKAEAEEIRNELEQYDKGKVPVEEVPKVVNEANMGKIVAYHLAHTNGITTKMKLPIGRSYAMFSLYPEAAELAREYVNTYSNDWKGWSLLAGAKAGLKSHDEALMAATNVVRLGSERNIATIGLLALSTDRVDIFENLLLKRLLVLKDATTNSVQDRLTGQDKLEIVTALVAYSLKAKKEEVFNQALKNVSAAQIKASEALRTYAEGGCEVFGSEATKKLCERLGTK
ncbi:MAG: hypothetical protein M9920_10280 [Verrucomicrobiae bacterium]|nr:hypothetical protein [Verrucomicrobiae bacterium]